LAGDNAAENLGWTAVGEVDEEPQAAARKLSATTKRERRFIG